MADPTNHAPCCKAVLLKPSIPLLLPLMPHTLHQIMYLMALHTFMYKSSNSGKYSYYAIAGIHGLNWDYNGQTPKGDSG